MNPAHRDRISFMRICSGVFDKGMSVYHKQSGKMVKLAQPQQFLAQERTIVEKHIQVTLSAFLIRVSSVSVIP